ncbi:saccharopine dehydrogenase NADP-binding domain-containing protein [Nodosilinea sp. LEGE 07088]|uniref:saccharopine dehydrogenase family protein n=1 Tax=Nodosilinea sp. LEGE 07088 TaxID=2777968 RepID=UPI00187F58E9|nr:saccharopine dehydrogenase NADP-binding domain-containing protein [Nodosilinea sp. LEGE 07088]MBE9137879.1 saccharopine dehydrogenase NADP-binding domain-containing protein [Nodosilinea sp. LEGE 07088]
MTQHVLLLGGLGRIGSSVAQDLLAHTDATLTLAGRRSAAGVNLTHPRQQYLCLDVADGEGLRRAIAGCDLVIHTAGPFSYRGSQVLQTCLDLGVNYLDVADHPPYVERALALSGQAAAAGVTAIVSTGVFPGISNSMARQGIEALEQPEAIHLSYVVAGSGGAGMTVMRTTFLELQHPIAAWIEGRWQAIAPYSQRQQVTFPAPYGDCAVYWFNTIEAMTLPRSFPVQTVTTKFGSLPDIYNHLTWLMAHAAPKGWLRQPKTIESLAQVSYRMTQVSDRFSGIGIAMRADVQGQQGGAPTTVTSTFACPDTAYAAGAGAGSVAQLLLTGQLHKPGVWPVEQAVTTPQFLSTLRQRELAIQRRSPSANSWV